MDVTTQPMTVLLPLDLRLPASCTDVNATGVCGGISCHTDYTQIVARFLHIRNFDVVCNYYDSCNNDRKTDIALIQLLRSRLKFKRGASMNKKERDKGQKERKKETNKRGRTNAGHGIQ